MNGKSLSVGLLAKIDENFSRSFLESKTRELTLGVLRFFDDSFKKSRFKGISAVLTKAYPDRIWRLLDKSNEMVNLDFLFNPFLLFPLVYLGFVGISTYEPSLLATVSIFAGLVFFMAGVRISGRVRFKEVFLEEYASRFAIALLVIGSAALVLDINRAGAVPLFEPFAKRGLSVTYTMLATVIVPGGILAISALGAGLKNGKISLREARVYALGVLLMTTILVSFLGYRTQIMVSLLGCGLAMYFSRIIGGVEIVATFCMAFLSLSLFGYLRAVGEGVSVGLFETLGRRVGLTLSIYDTLVNLYWPFGVNRGSVALSTFSSYLAFVPGPELGPRTIVARMFGVYDVSMTSTLFGTLMLDFGILGIVSFALALGLTIGAAYHAARQTRSALATAIVSLLLAYALVGIETGLVDFNVFMFFFISFLVLVKSRK
jgi:oligosaccharide repeat unit polymerase